MRDLLGVVPEVMDATKQFPADQETHGFTNVGAGQALSQHQLSLYLRAARTYLDSALVFGQEEPQTHSGDLGRRISPKTRVATRRSSIVF